MHTEDLYETHYERLAKFARSLTKDDKEAEDLVQDTYLKAMMHESTLHGLNEHQQRAWLFQVLKNLRRDRFRKQRREVLTNEEEPLCGALEDYSEMEIRELLARLPEELSDVVYKRYWLGMNSKQIAEPLGITASTVRYRLQTAIARLRQEIET
ncbi:MAG TPA: sigma-70 family RNA polymerase sigma factor [Bacillales bacterium]|nr:sigma-70 family RNA polymerase sigma factor [Bacillales bacterium]